MAWYAPGAEFDRPARNRSKRDTPRCEVLDIGFCWNWKGFWKECFFSIVLIRINVSSFGMLFTTLFSSSSLISIWQQLSSSVGNGYVWFAVTQLCSLISLSVIRLSGSFSSIRKINSFNSGLCCVNVGGKWIGSCLIFSYSAGILLARKGTFP